MWRRNGWWGGGSGKIGIKSIDKVVMVWDNGGIIVTNGNWFKKGIET